MTDTVHDLIVVGAGIGGLTAAALCAADGLDVVVLEGHTRPGGCAGDFVRRRVLFPAGATVVMGFEEGGLHRRVYERLGLPIVARRLETAMRVHLPDREVGVSTDRAAWGEERRRAFPEAGRGGERFWSRVERLGAVAHDLAARGPTLPIGTLDDLLDAARLVRPGMLGALPALWRTVDDLLKVAGIADDVPHRRFVDNQLLISMQCPANECVALSGALALDVYRYGTSALPEGTATIATDLVSALRARGGRIQYGAEVRQLRREPGRWVVTTSQEERLAARSVIANLPLADLLRLLGDQAPVRMVMAGRRRVQPWGAAVLYAALDPDRVPGPLPSYHQVVESYDGSLDDGGSCFVSLFSPEAGREGGPARLTVSTHTTVEPWWQIDSRAEYLERKAQLGERLLRAAEASVPGLRRAVRFSEVATPRSFARWTGRHEGRVGGLAQSTANANLRALSHRTGLPGLFLCGDSVFPGQGTIGVTLSGITAARSTVRYARTATSGWWGRVPRIAGAGRTLAHSRS